MKQRLLRIFDILLTAFGKRYWWPGESQLEIAVGAILTQNTSWKNVEKAILNLKNENMLDVKKLHEIEVCRLSEIIKPAGFYNIKAFRLKNFIKAIYEDHCADINSLCSADIYTLRRLLLNINGVGHETADSIILYALNRPIFVVDAYTKRFLKNHNLYCDQPNYNNIQNFFMENLPHDTYLFNEFHALIVCLWQGYCKKIPRCNECPLQNDLESNQDF